MLITFLFALSLGVANSEHYPNDRNATNSACRIREARWSRESTEMALRCGSPAVLVDYMRRIVLPKADENGTQFTSVELVCSGQESITFDTTIKLSKRYQKKLYSLSVQNCDFDALDVLNLFKRAKILNISRNYFTEFRWQKMAHMEVQILDVRNNFLDCSQCVNRWLRVFSRANARKPLPQQFWNVYYVFRFVPHRIYVDDSSFRRADNKTEICTFVHCSEERISLDPLTIATELGDPLRMECHFSTDASFSSTFLKENSPFQWLLRDSENSYENEAISGTVTQQHDSSVLIDARAASKSDAMDDKKKQTYSLTWRDKYRTAIFNKYVTTSDDLGFVACRCLICDVPIFNVSQVRFEVNVTAVIKDQVDGAGDSQMIVHGYPLERVLLQITRLSDNTTERQTLSENEPNSFFNDSFLVKYQAEHSHFFLKYYLFYIHECADCNHAMAEGDYLLAICQRNDSNCIEIMHRFSFRTSNTMFISMTNAPAIAVRGMSAFIYAVIFSFVIAASAGLLWLAARSPWKMHRKIPLLNHTADWEFKRRRISRNTNRTEETSIPLEDTLSNTGLSTSYSFVAQHVPMIDAKELSVKYKIGKGAFGEVFTADWEQMKEKVAVKTLHMHMDAEMDKEAAILAKLDHRNVLKLYGVSNLNGKIALVMEMMNQGDLKNYLRGREPRCDNYSQFPPALLQTELINISMQVCTGLSYLFSQQIVHRDLATRNCLVSGETDAHICSPAFRPPITIKISDFGMSRRLYSDAEYYRMHDSKTALPVRWLPPECLSFGKFTHQSDMWSFGVTLFEIFTYGGMPFGNLSNGEVLTAVVSGMRPELPPKCPEKIADIIKQCWLDEPADRINADDALIRLGELQ